MRHPTSVQFIVYYCMLFYNFTNNHIHVQYMTWSWWNGLKLCLLHQWAYSNHLLCRLVWNYTQKYIYISFIVILYWNKQSLPVQEIILGLWTGAFTAFISSGAPEPVLILVYLRFVIMFHYVLHTQILGCRDTKTQTYLYNLLTSILTRKFYVAVN